MILEEWNDLVASNQSNEIHCWNRLSGYSLWHVECCFFWQLMMCRRELLLELFSFWSLLFCTSFQDIILLLFTTNRNEWKWYGCCCSLIPYRKEFKLTTTMHVSVTLFMFVVPSDSQTMGKAGYIIFNIATIVTLFGMAMGTMVSLSYLSNSSRL